MQLNLRLLNKTPEEVKIALSNYEQLFMETLEHWDTNLFSKYINQSYQSSISKVASYIFYHKIKIMKNTINSVLCYILSQYTITKQINTKPKIFHP